MTDTVKIDISDTEWTDISSSVSAGLITNNSEHSIRYRYAAAQPSASDTFGHVLHPQDEVNFSLSNGEIIWALGFFDDAKVALSKTNPTPVKTQLNTTAFGDLKAEKMTPVVQISAEYGLIGQALTVVDPGASGTASVIDNKFTAQSGTAADGVAAILTNRLLSYRPGQGALARLTALFTTGVALSRQLAGLITAENSFAFGYIGADFGIIHTHDGESEYQELTITTPAAGSENATVTVNGVGYTVPLTAGTVQHNAFEIANSLTAQVPNYDFSSNNDQVLAEAVLNGPAGAFAFSSATAVAAWIQITAGVLPVTDFTPQDEWSEDTLSSWSPALDPTKGNVYAVQMQYLGFGGIKFFVEDPASADFILVHIIKFANTATTPSVTNPSFRIGWVVRNFGNTSNLTVAGASAAGFIEGEFSISAPPRSDGHDQLAVGTTLTSIITFRNRINFGGKRNRAELLPLLLSLSTQANKSAFFQIIANPIFGGDMDFNYVDKNSSIMEVAKDAVTISGGQLVGGATVVAGSSIPVEFNIRDWHKFAALPGATFSIAARVSGGAAADMQTTATWVEDT